ncbi:MAG: flagellar assembly protein FliH [Leptospiraceae bacterium]|nr:flagellar assembly protein FliH [Leptospiraceae bacterium]MDW8305972.1 flagellar assembly protein FliH [Leptospiraceae bacterium]
MARLVYRPEELAKVEQAMLLELPERYKKFQQLDELTEFELDAEGNIVEQYTGPSIEEIEAELERYREETEAEIKQQLKEAEKERQRIIEEGRAEAFRLIQDAKEKAKKEEENARLQSEQIVERAKLEVERMVKEAEMRVADIEHEAYQKGYNAGREIGYREGQGEVRRLIDRLGTILGHAIDVREQIVRESEKLMVEMILMIARKVIKDEIIERKEVVLNNIREALARIKERDRIDIRVNFADLELTTAHKDEIIKMMESLRKVNIYEDSRVDRGGVIIETDVGAIDARISTQLKEIEQAIRDARPM